MPVAPGARDVLGRRKAYPAKQALERVGRASRYRDLRDALVGVARGRGGGQLQPTVRQGVVLAALDADVQKVPPLSDLQDEGHVRAHGYVREREGPVHLGRGGGDGAALEERRAAARVGARRHALGQRFQRGDGNVDGDVVDGVSPGRVVHLAAERGAGAAAAHVAHEPRRAGPRIEAVRVGREVEGAVAASASAAVIACCVPSPSSPGPPPLLELPQPGIHPIAANKQLAVMASANSVGGRMRISPC